MTPTVIPFHPRHLFELRPQRGQEDVAESLSVEHATALGKHPSATVVCDREILMCGGVVPVWQGRSLAWSYLSRDCGEHMVFLHRETKRFIEKHATRRVEMAVEFQFEQGHRWAKLLGFEQEVPLMRAYFPNGNDASLYVGFF